MDFLHSSHLAVQRFLVRAAYAMQHRHGADKLTTGALRPEAAGIERIGDRIDLFPVGPKNVRVINQRLHAQVRHHLTGKEDYLVALTHSSGSPRVRLPNDVADLCLYLVIYGNTSGEFVDVEPLDPRQNIRVKFKGTGNPGDQVTLAPINGTDDGKAQVLPATADIYHVIGHLEEAAVDGQLALVRPVDRGLVTVT